ncbi:MAG: class I tRNA ligase family protein, partial [Chloroflexota bacterium]|nr:class I tRNA ligase family protein [Chloroflexota bacterium]
GPIARTTAWRETAETLTLLMAPSTPYVAEELWSRLGKPFSVHQQPWPAYDETLTVEEVDEVVVQVNGRVRDRLTLARGTGEDDARAQALASERVQEHLGGKAPTRVIYVPGRLVNIVVK